MVDEMAMDRIVAGAFAEGVAQARGVPPQLARPGAGNQTELHRLHRIPPVRVQAGGEEIELEGGAIDRAAYLEQPSLHTAPVQVAVNMQDTNWFVHPSHAILPPLAGRFARGGSLRR